MDENENYFSAIKEGDFRSVLENEQLPNQHPYIQMLVNYVREISEDVDRPTRKFFDPNKLRPLLPYICIYDVLYKDEDFYDAKLRLFGTELVNVYGEVTGLNVSQYPVEGVSNRVMADCELVIKTKKIVIGSVSSLDKEKNYIKLLKVLIPFFDHETDNNKITQIVSLIQFNS